MRLFLFIINTGNEPVSDVSLPIIFFQSVVQTDKQKNPWELSSIRLSIYSILELYSTCYCQDAHL